MAFSQSETGLWAVVGSDFNLFLFESPGGRSRRGIQEMPLRAGACTLSTVTIVPISPRKANLMAKPGASEVEKRVPTTRKHGKGRGWEGRLKNPTAT